MNPQQAPTITNEQIDQILNSQREALRNIYRAVASMQAPCGGVKLVDLPLPNGQTMGILLYLANEPMANLIAGTIQGFDGMSKTFQRLQGAPTQTQTPPPAAPPPPPSNAFGL